ncbi:ArsR/SmtB family transcription factor [Chloroflexota bacterium]
MNLGPAEIFKILGVESRIKIVELLKTRGPIGVNELAELLDITPAAVSQHLKILRHAGLVTSERQGYFIPYSLDEEALENCRCVMNDVCSCGCHPHDEQLGPEIDGSDLAHLRAYEARLQSELKRVQQEIADILSKEK